MQVREYLSVRRAFNIVRQRNDVAKALTFEEFSILCHLFFANGSLRTSDIAEYQRVLRPTMTHRANHLDEQGLISRFAGPEDRRTVRCEITPEGAEAVQQIAELCVARIRPGMSLNRAEPERILRYSDAMGQLYCTSGDLVLLALSQGDERGLTVSGIVKELGLLQPTASMAVSQLSREGLLEREPGSSGSLRSGRIMLSDEGRRITEGICEAIDGLVARRKPRKNVE